MEEEEADIFADDVFEVGPVDRTGAGFCDDRADAFADLDQELFVFFEIDESARDNVRTATHLTGFGINQCNDHKHAIFGEHLTVADYYVADIADTEAVHHDIVHHR